MTRSAEAIVNPEILVWGRETIGYDVEEAAKKIGVRPERLADWELGERRPTVKQLFRIANVYKRPFAAFYFSSPPTYWDEPYDKLEDWRTHPKTRSMKRSPGLILELREAARRREILLDLAEEMDQEIPKFELFCLPNESAVQLANRVRRSLGKSIEFQHSCTSPVAALNKWRLAVENLGVLVFQTGFFGGHYPVDIKRDMRGAAIHFKHLPIIIINSQDSITGRIFMIAHELGHLILGQSGLSNFTEHDCLVPAEIFCGDFAGELLVPSSAILSNSIATGHQWDDEDLNRLANEYKVGKAVVLERLLKNRRMTESNYKDLLAKWNRDSELTNGLLRNRQSGGPAYHMKFVRCHGPRFVATVFEAFDNSIIDAGQLAEYLGVKLKHLENIRSDLNKALL